VALGFVEDIHVSSNTCKDVQACANTGNVSDEKSKNVQTHASLSKDFAGSLLDAGPPESGVPPKFQPLSFLALVARLFGEEGAKRVDREIRRARGEVDASELAWFPEGRQTVRRRRG
jgi:hypothetical protein